MSYVQTESALGFWVHINRCAVAGRMLELTGKRIQMVKLKVNAVERSFEGDPDMPLLWYLGDILGLTGTKFVCGMALCDRHLLPLFAMLFSQPLARGFAICRSPLAAISDKACQHTMEEFFP